MTANISSPTSVLDYPTTLDQITAAITNYGIALIDYVAIGIAFILVFIIGYILGYIISKVLRRILMIGELQKTLVRYGAVTTKMWESIVNFITQYIIWLTVVFVIHTAFVHCTIDSATDKIICEYPLIDSLFIFMVNLLSLILFTSVGLLVGGVLYKIVKDAMETIGLETELVKHKIVESSAGISFSSILASIVKWFVVLLFLTSGVQQFLSTIQLGDKEPLKLQEAMEGLMDYIPKAILGILVILASLILASFSSERIKYSTVSFSHPLALVAEILILFFGIVLALPNLFGVNDTNNEIFALTLGAITDSFKILMAGLSLGLAIAIGLGLKDAVAKAGIKYEKKLEEGR